MKKFLTAMMFALIVVLHSPSNVSAFYADGYHYFCVVNPYYSSSDWDESYRVTVYVIRNGVHQGGMTVDFGRKGGTWYYHIFNGAGGFAPVSSNRFAQLVFDDITAEERKRREEEAQQKRREEEQQRLAAEKKRREAEARELEKQRLAEQKRRREEARKNEFNKLIAAGDQAYIAGDYPAAVQSYESARKLDKASVDKFFGELVKNGDNLKAQGNLPAALDYYKKAVVMNLNPYYDDARDKLFNTYFSSKNFSDAANFFRTMTTIKPEDNDLWFTLGRILDELKDYEGAIAAYTRSLEQNPEEAYPIKYSKRGAVYKNLGRYDEAIADYKKSLNCINPADEDLDNLWDAYCKSGKIDDAVDFYNKRVTANPNDSESWFLLGRSLNEQKKFPEAINAMQKFAKLRNTAGAYLRLAQIYENAGDTKKALEVRQKAQELELKPVEYSDAGTSMKGGAKRNREQSVAADPIVKE